MPIFGLVTKFEPEDEPYMYRQEDDGTTTPVSKQEYKEETDKLYRSGYYDSILADLDEPDKPDNSGGGFFGWLCR